MSIAEDYTRTPTYDSLVEMIKIYLNRRDTATTDMIPFFVNAAEKAILRNIRIPSMEKLVKFDASSATGGYIELPYDYVEMKFVWTEGENPGTLERVPFDRLLRGAPSISGTSTGTYQIGEDAPVTLEDTYSLDSGDYNSGYWAINGNRMYFCGAETSEVFITYYCDIPELRSDTQSNTFLTLVPDAFLYLAVSEGWKFLMEPEKSQYWESFGMQRLAALQLQSDNAEFSGSPLTIAPI